jgi:hypothetical protein
MPAERADRTARLTRRRRAISDDAKGGYEWKVSP